MQPASQPASKLANLEQMLQKQIGLTEVNMSECSKKDEKCCDYALSPRPLLIMLNKRSFGFWWGKCQLLIEKNHFYSLCFYYLDRGGPFVIIWYVAARQEKTSNLIPWSISGYPSIPRKTKWKQILRFLWNCCCATSWYKKSTEPLVANITWSVV